MLTRLELDTEHARGSAGRMPAAARAGARAAHGELGLLQALVRCNTVLLEREDFDGAIVEGLRILCLAGGFDRGCLHDHVAAEGADTPQSWRVLHEWHGAEAPPQRATAHATGPVSWVADWYAQAEAGAATIDARLADQPGPEFRAAQATLGVRYTIAAPVRIEGAMWGWLAFDDCRTDRLRGAAEKAAVAAAAQTFGLAVHRRREQQLRADEREAAVRQRGDELARANEVMQRMLAELAARPDPRAFLGRVLRELTVQLGMDAAQLALCDESGERLTTYALVDGAQVVADDAAFPATVAAHSVAALPLLRALRAPRRFDLVADAHLFWPGTLEFHRQRGSRAVWCMPLRFGARFAGFLGIASRAERALAPEQLALAQALCQQAALAAELIRLGEREREAAVARERELAARDRAAELAKVNEALRRGLDGATGSGRLEDLIRSILCEAASVFAADAAALLLREGDGTCFRPLAVVDDARLLTAGEIARDTFLGAYAEASARDPGGIFSAIVAATANTETVFDDTLRVQWPEAHAWHAGRGHRTAWQFPMRMRGQVRGFFAFALRRAGAPSGTQIESVAALAQQLMLAVEMSRLAEQARDTAVARGREQAQARRTAELETTNRALQATIDATAALTTFDEFIPAALRIVGQAFGVRGAGYFETIDRVIFLRFWLHEGRVCQPEGLPGLTEQDRAHMRRLAGGFTVPVAHLGVDCIDRPSRPNVVDNSRATASPELHAWACRMGWPLELNVPLMVEGRAQGAITLYRAAERPFTDAEIALGESLGKQIALAMQARRIAEREREAAIARDRAAELAKANAALSRSTAQLVRHDSLTGFLESVLRESIAAMGAVSGAVFLLEAAGQHLHLRTMVLRGEILDIATDARAEAYRQPIAVAGNVPWQRMTQRQFFWLDYATRDPDDWPQSYDWHNAMGHRFGVCVPMVHDGTPIGFLGLVYDRSVEVQPADARLEVALVLAQHATLAVRLTRLADEAREAALARDRAAAVHERTAELERANEALRRAIGDLADIDAIDDFLTELLRAAIDAAGAANGTISLIKGDELERPVILHGTERVTRQAKERLGVLRGPAGALVQRLRQAHAEGRTWRPSMDELIAAAPATAVNHRALGNRAVRFVPLLVRGELVGWIGLGFTHEPAEPLRGADLLRVLAGQITVAVEMARLGEEARSATLAEERNRVAGEIHDSLAQNFAGVALQLETAEDALQHGELDAAQASVGRARDLARFGLAEARRSVMTLRPSATLAMGLAPALEALCARSKVEGKLGCFFEARGDAVLLDGEIELTLFRIAQEALSNAVRHAHASRIVVTLEHGRGGVTLAVADDGLGLQPAAQASSAGQGLPAMRDRAARVGGHCDVSSPAAGGTRVSAWVPYRR